MDSTPQDQTPPKASSFLASIMSNSEATSRPSSSYSTQTAFSNSSTTSLASTLATASTSSTTVPKWNIHKPQYDAKGQALDAMTRRYPVADERLSLDEMLSLPPLPRTFRYEIQKDEVEKGKELVESQEKKKAEVEEAKKRLRELAFGLK